MPLAYPFFVSSRSTMSRMPLVFVFRGFVFDEQACGTARRVPVAPSRATAHSTREPVA